MDEKELLKIIERAAIENQTVLDLSDNELSVLPPEICQLTNLKTLYLSRNRLSTLPPEISELTNLEILRLFNNELSKLPPEICQIAFSTRATTGRKMGAVARLTPMRRGLKLSFSCPVPSGIRTSRKTYPDEKGIETFQLSGILSLLSQVARLTPMEGIHLNCLKTVSDWKWAGYSS